MKSSPDLLPVSAARTLFLHGQGLLRDPTAKATPTTVLKTISLLGFVQVDSINVVERAHHHILWTRLHGYRPAHLDQLRRKQRVFEHWTHDASIIPAEWFPHWRHRFARVADGSWIQKRLGDRSEDTLRCVRERIRAEGPLLARDFEHDGHRGGPWWDWRPAKAALEYCWRAGEFAIAGRSGAGGFEKVYDLSERVLTDVHSLPAPHRDEHVDWACRTALDRLGSGTPREIAAFWNHITVAQAAEWCAAAVRAGRVVPVCLEGTTVRTDSAVALPDWRRRVRRAQAAPGPKGMRLLSPFDPLVRDRARCLRLFGFDYRFEAYVPAPKRRYGYYVCPILEHSHGGRARLVGRLDPKFDRGRSTLSVRGIWWEEGVRATRARKRALDQALERYALFVGAKAIERPPS